jgi:sugar lactone lactonase YvrE
MGMKLSVLGAVLLACAVFASPACADSEYTFTTLAGTPGTLVASADGTGSDAQFSAPRGVAVDSAGNLYVADSSNHTIRKVTAAGVTTTLAGVAGTQGTTSANPAKFVEPFGVAVDSSGNVYVADTNNNAIRKITAAGVVTTLAGGSGMGSTDGTGSAAKFREPHGLVLDSAGNIYVSDYMNHAVRKVTQEGVVTTLAGSLGNSGFTNGQGTAARFSSPQGIAIDSSGNLYLAESHNRTIRKITPSGLVTSLYESSGGALGAPSGVAVDASGNVYVADYGSHVIKKITAAGVLSLVAGTSTTSGSTDGASTAALFYLPSAVAVDSANNLYVADTSNNTIRKITSGGTVSTLAGLATRSSSVNGTGSAARFADPYAIAVDGSGNAYVADATDHSIRKITAAGVVTTLAGNPGTYGSADGSGSAALFKAPLGIAADSSGTVYVADTGNSTIRKITPAGVVTTLAGKAGMEGATDGTGTAARFYSPYGVATDSAGNVFVLEAAGVVRKITAAGVVTTLAGTANSPGLVDGTGTTARFSVPFDLTVDTAGNIYVSDHGNHAVRKITPAGVVTTLAGSGSSGYANGTGTAAQFKFPSGIGVDTAGNVFLADTDNQVIRKITPDGVVTTVAGTHALGSADGVGTAASFYNPKDVAFDASGNMYVTDRGNHTIRKGTLATTTTSTTSTTTTTTTTTTLASTSLNLSAGWNLLGNGGTTSLNVSNTALFGDQNKVTSVWKWVATSSKWAVYLPSLSSTELASYAAGKGYSVLSSIAGGEGFWVNAKIAYSATLPAAPAVTAATVQANLASGWNLVAVGETKSPGDFNATALWAWEKNSSSWYFYASSLNTSGGLAAHIQKRGYLDFSSANKTLGQGVGFWVKKP